MKMEHTFLGMTEELFQNRQSDGPTLMVPLCQRHRSYRRWWPGGGHVLLWLPLVILVFVGIARLSVVALGLGAALIVADVCAFAWLVKQSVRIRVTRSDSTHMVLVGLAPAFAQACQEEQRRDAELFQQSLDGLPPADTA